MRLRPKSHNQPALSSSPTQDRSPQSPPSTSPTATLRRAKQPVSEQDSRGMPHQTLPQDSTHSRPPIKRSNDTSESVIPSPSSSPPGSSSTKSHIATFRGWPISYPRKHQTPAYTPPPLQQELSTSSSSSSSWWTRSPTNSHLDRLQSASCNSSPLSSNPSSPSSRPLSRSTSSSSSAASTSSSASALSVTVTAPTASAFQHPFIPRRPYSAPVDTLTPSASSSSGPRRRFTGDGNALYDAIPEGIVADSPFSPRVPSPDSNADDDNKSERSTLHSVTVVNEPERFLLHVRLPGFKPSNLLISSRRDRSLLITADRFDDEVHPVLATASAALSTSPGRSARPTVDTPPERLAGHFERCVQFGPDADPSKATAHFDGDVLKIVVPKKKAFIDFVQRNGSNEKRDGSPCAEGPQNVDKSPRSIALALSAASRHSPPPARGRSPASEATSPESESASGSTDDSNNTSEVSSPDSDGQCAAHEDDVAVSDVTAGLDQFQMDDHQGIVSLDTPSGSPHQPKPHPSPSGLPTPIPSQRPRSTSPNRTYSKATSAAMRRSRATPQSHAPSTSESLSDSEATNVRREMGYGDDDLVTPTPQRMKRTRGEASTSPKKDYFGFPLMPITPPRMSLRPEKVDASPERRTSSPPPATASSLLGRTREQGLGRSAFFWKRWAP